MIYLALGDSTGVGVGAGRGGGYPQRLLRLLGRAELQLENLCESGATSVDLREDQLPRALRLKPALITIGIGINDLGLQIPDDAFAVNLEEITAPLHKLCPRIALANLPDLSHSPTVSRLIPATLYQRRIDAFNEHVAATAARHHLALIDLFAFSQRELPQHPEYFSPDGFHPSAQGYEAWAQAMLPQVQALLER